MDRLAGAQQQPAPPPPPPPPPPTPPPPPPPPTPPLGGGCWTKDIEIVLEAIRYNSIVLSDEHKRHYILLKNALKYFRLPVIIISACNSVISVSTQPYLTQAYISIITCLLALSCGIIGSIELFFAIQVKMETELMASKDYYILGTDIFKMLTLSPENRNVDARSFLDNSYSQYIKLTESSCIILRKLDDKLTNVGPATTTATAAAAAATAAMISTTDNVLLTRDAVRVVNLADLI